MYLVRHSVEKWGKNTKNPFPREAAKIELISLLVQSLSPGKDAGNYEIKNKI